MAAPTELFVGRQHEIDALRACFDAACSGVGSLALLAGEPGIGKTRTASELSDHAKGRKALVWWGRCHEETGAPPYWPWVQIIRAASSSGDSDDLRADLGAGAPDIADIVPEIRARLPDLDTPAALSDPAETRFRLFGAIARFLINISRRRPLVLVLDDLHWADVPSLRLLEFLAQEVGDSRLLVVGTYRETEVSRQHRLSDTLGALARAPRIIRLRLTGLNADEVRRFVTTAAGMVPPASLTRAIHDQTEGNPLFVREVVRFLAQEGHFSGAATDATSLAATKLPEGVREVIGRRLNLLSAACNEILAVASVIGREFSLGVLVRANRTRTEEAVLEAIDEALAARIVEETSPGYHQFTHALIRVTLYDELRTGLRRRLHHTVGEAIEAMHRRDPEPVLADLAFHFRSSGLGGDVERAIDYAVRAGKRADAAFASEDAVNFFQSALDMLDTLSIDDPERRCDLLLHLGDTQRKTNDYPTAMETLRAAADIARSHQMRVAMARVAEVHADAAWRHNMHTQQTERVGPLLEEALAGLPAAEIALRVRLLSGLARDRFHNGAEEEGKALVRRSIAMAREQGDPAALATSLAGRGDTPWWPNETTRLLADAIEMTELAERANLLEVVSRGYHLLVQLHLELGDSQSADAAFDGLWRVHLRLRQRLFTLYEHSMKAALLLMRGALGEAERLIIEIMKTQSPHLTFATDPVSMLIFTLRREQARLRELGPMVAMFMRRNAGARVWRPGLALLYVELGDPDSSRAVFDGLAEGDFAALPRDARFAASLTIPRGGLRGALGDPSRGPRCCTGCCFRGKAAPSSCPAAPCAGDRADVFWACWRRCEATGRTPNGTSPRRCE